MSCFSAVSKTLTHESILFVCPVNIPHKLLGAQIVLYKMKECQQPKLFLSPLIIIYANIWRLARL